MNNWNVIQADKLEKDGILLIQDGNHGEYRPRQNEFGEGDTYFIRASDMEDGQVLFQTAEKINDIALNRIRKGIGKPGDVIFSHKGTVGKLALVPMNAPFFVCSPQTTFWRTLNESVIDRNYLYYYMASTLFSNQWKSRKGETDMADYVSLTAQRELYVTVPPIDQQHKMVQILKPFNDKIELNHQMNQTLEDLASTLFKSWFIDFDPVLAKAEGKKPFGMSDDIAALFPDSFEESELGSIPKGWKVIELDNIANFLNGLALQKYPPENEVDSLPVIKIAQLREGKPENADRASSNLDKKYIIDDGDIIFSWSGSLLVTIWCGGKGALNQHLFRVTSNQFPKWFYYEWIKYHLPEFQAIAADKATTMGHIKREHLKEAKVLLPSPQLLTKMDELMSPLVEKRIANNLESRTLNSLLDLLLPKLFSGEIDLNQTEKLVEEAV